MNGQFSRYLRWRIALLCVSSVVLVACGKGPDALMQSGNDYLAKGEVNAAVIQLRNAAARAPERADIRFALGMALQRQRDLLAAEKELRRALELGYAPDSVVPLLARVMNGMQQSDKVLTDFGERKLGTASAESARLAEVGTALMRTGKTAEARSAFNAAIAADSSSGPGRLGLAILDAADGRPKEALAKTERILQDQPRFADALALKGGLLRGSGDVAGAKAAFEQAVAADATQVDTWFALAELAIDQGALDEAAKRLEAARRYSGADLRLPYLNGLLAFRKGDNAKAREMTQAVLKYAPNHVPTLVLAGAIELKDGQTDMAEAHLRRALGNAPADHEGARRLLATAYLKTGDGRRALETLQPLLASGKGVKPEVMALAAEASLAAGDMKAATGYYTAAAEADKSNVISRTRLAQISIASGKQEKGLNELEAAAALDSKQSQADVALIQEHLRANDLPKALAAAQAFEKKQPNNPAAHHLLGVVQSARKETSAARASFSRALELQPGYLLSAAALAGMDLADKKPDEGRRRFESVISYNEKNNLGARNAEALTMLSEYQRRTGGAGKEIIATLQRAVAADTRFVPARLALISAHMRARDANAAYAAALDATSRIPGDPRIVDAFIAAAEASGQREQAKQELGKLVAAQPNNAELLRRMAALQMRGKETDRAIETLRRAQKAKPDDVAVSRDLAGALLTAGRHDAAMAEAKAVQTRNPKSGEGFDIEGDILAARRASLPEAETAYRTSQRLQPDSGLAALKLHAAMSINGKAKEADAFIVKWIADHPKDVPSRMYLGDRRSVAKDYAAAAKYYEQVVALQPNHAVATNNLAYAYGELGDARAIGMAERAVKLAPESASTQDTLGMLLIKSGNMKRGFEVLDEARRLAPDNDALNLNYARALIAAGRKDEARRLLETLQARPVFTGKDEIPALLKTL